MLRASVIPISKELIKEANSIFNNFIWNGKDKVKRLALISDIEMGGLKMLDIQSMISAKRVISLYSNMEIDCEKVYTLAFQCTLDTKIREFQYKILNCIIFTNENLNLIGVVESPNCTFCQEATESVEHLLFSCRITSNFWKHVLSWLRDNHVHVGIINEPDIIFGKFDIVKDYILINHILLLGKCYIYYRKCQNSLPTLRGFITTSRRVLNIELHIAREKINFFFIYKSGRS